MAPDLRELAPITPDWRYTGSSTSGLGYGASILKDDRTNTYAVGLSYQGIRRIQPCASRQQATEIEREFCRVCDAWNRLVRTGAVIRRGYAVLGDQLIDWRGDGTWTPATERDNVIDPRD